MLKIGLIREGKLPADNRVVLTPPQCKWIQKNADDIEITSQDIHDVFTHKKKATAQPALTKSDP